MELPSITLRELQNIINLLCLADDSLRFTEQNKEIGLAHSSIVYARKILKKEKEKRFTP